MRKNPVFSTLWRVLVPVVVLVSCQKYDSPEGGFTRPGLLTTEIKMAMEAATDKIFSETATPGMLALVAVEGEADFIITRGTANTLTSEPIQEQNAFRIGSVTKTFTGTVVLLLADEGLIHLDSSIAFYLPEKGIPSGSAITIRMLGTMTSGLFNYSDDPALWEPFINSGYTLEMPPDTLLAIAFRHPMNFAPGTSYEYCNTNTVLLGLLIEKITGKPAYQVINEKVVLPLKLFDTYMGGPFFRSGPYTHGYSFQEEGLLDATNWNPSWGYTAGAMISTPGDMKRWARLLAEGALLSEASKTERFNFNSDNYGFAVELANYKGQRWYGHPGLLPGYNTQVWYNTEKKITLVISSNTETGAPAEKLLIEFITLLGNL